MYNWANRGVTVCGEKIFLRTEMRGGVLHSTITDVEEFLARINRQT